MTDFELDPRLEADSLAVMDLELWNEVRRVARVLQSVFAPIKLNIAALGNQVRQLHVHAIARFQDDATSPGPVWGVALAEAYPDPDPDPVIARLRLALNSA